MDADRTLVLSRRFAAPRERVFAAWTDPAQSAHWWGPRGFTTVSTELDVRVGGAWRRCLRRPDGTLRCGRGVYREIVAPERLVFTYAWEDETGTPGHQTLVTVSFAEEDGATVLTLHQALFATAADCEAHRGGWSSTLDRLAELVSA